MLTAAERAALDRRSAHCHHALRHPPPLVVDSRLANALTIFEAHFPNATFAWTAQSLADWKRIGSRALEQHRADSHVPFEHATTTPAASTNVVQAVHNRAPMSYVRALVAGAYHDVAFAEIGNRNNSLSRSAFRFGQVVGAGLLEEGVAIAALEEAATKCGLPHREALSAIRSGLRAGTRRPLEVQ
jgi:hypothetical protein